MVEVRVIVERPDVPVPDPPSGSWPSSRAQLETGIGRALSRYDGPSPIYPPAQVTLSGFTRSSMFGEGSSSAPAPSVVRFSWAHISMTGGNSFRPKAYCDWEITDSIIEGDSATVASPIHGDIVHCLLGKGPITFRRCLLRWLNSGSINVQLTGMVNLENWSGTVTFEDCALVHQGFGGFYPIRHGSGANLVFRRCQMPDAWDNRYPDGTQGTMVLVGCTDHDGDAIPDQTWVNRTRTFD